MTDNYFSTGIQSHVITNQPYFCGVCITPQNGETVRQILERCFTFVPPAVSLVIDLVIQMPCGASVTYKTLDEIPVEDVPCTCGNPHHFFVKINKVLL
jgi:hypothetical protein